MIRAGPGATTPGVDATGEPCRAGAAPRPVPTGPPVPGLGPRLPHLRRTDPAGGRRPLPSRTDLLRRRVPGRHHRPLPIGRRAVGARVFGRFPSSGRSDPSPMSAFPRAVRRAAPCRWRVGPRPRFGWAGLAPARQCRGVPGPLPGERGPRGSQPAQPAVPARARAARSRLPRLERPRRDALGRLLDQPRPGRGPSGPTGSWNSWRRRSGRWPRSPSRPTELDRVRESAIGEIPLALETASDAHELAVDAAYHGLPDRHWREWPTILRGISAAAIRDAAAPVFDPARAVTVVAGPAAPVALVPGGAV